ncbi:XdhC family protein [Leeuwenhoekiella sp. H156]|uniref:XdhC family protein n=1 Tax=Leeuwenhoekiella sp. H156 TaxID=3450128 RepID=UPI003FA446BE
MTHEFLEILNQAKVYKSQGISCVLATVVALDGSSYRKPGVRMLIAENGAMTGAVSGGCVEKEVVRRAESVFKTGVSKIMTYDGRYRLGCEGVLYILLERFEASDQLVHTFENLLSQRESFEIVSFYKKEDEATGNFGSFLRVGEKNPVYFQNTSTLEASAEALRFKQTLNPRFKLLLVGGEHDTVKLCTMAAMLGWEVDVITSLKDPKELKDFPGAAQVIGGNADTFDAATLDAQTAVVLMTHNYAQDLQYLVKLKDLKLPYLGILGSVKRREKIQHELLDYAPDLDLDFLEQIYSPAGLNIGSITPEEIALSILAEILAVTRNRNSLSLKTLTGKINSAIS